MKPKTKGQKEVRYENVDNWIITTLENGHMTPRKASCDVMRYVTEKVKTIDIFAQGTIQCHVTNAIKLFTYC